MSGRTVWSSLALALILAPALGARPAAAGRHHELVGIVLGPDSKPVAGCRATFGEMSALSDDRGRFRLEEPETLFEEDSVLVLDAPGLAVRRVRLRRLPHRPSFDLGAFQLSAGVEIGGTVLDPSGGPRPGARVLLVTPVGLDEALSGPDGRFRFSRLEPGRYDLAVEAEGFPVAAWRGVSLLESRTLEPIGLETGVELRGRLNDDAGDPMAGLGVRVLHDSSVPPFLKRLDDPVGARARSDRNGRFRLRGLRAGSNVVLDVETGSVWTHKHQLRVPATRAVVLGALTLPTFRSVSGRVVDATGEPIPGARVIPRRKGSPMGGTHLLTEAGPDGAFRLPPLKPGTILVHASALGFRTLEVELEVDGGASPGSAEPHLEIVLETVPSGALEISVRPHPGTELPRGAELRLTGLAGAAKQVAEVHSLAELGRARWERLPVGPYRVLVVGDRSEPPHQERVEIGAGANELVITLAAPAPAAEVAGELLGPHSEPVPFAWLWFGSTDHPGRMISTLSDSRGRWQARLPPGDYQVSIDHADYVPLDLAEVKVDMGTRALGPWQLERGLELSGRVRGLTAIEASLLEVKASSENHQVAGEIEPEGRFRIARLTPGDWTIQASIWGTPREISTRVSVPAGGSAPEVVLDLPGGEGGHQPGHR